MTKQPFKQLLHTVHCRQNLHNKNSPLWTVGCLIVLLLAFPFNNVQSQCTTMDGRVFTDFNLDGVFDTFPFEVGVEGVTVQVYDNNGTLLDSDVTDCEGLYQIDFLDNLSAAVDQSGADCSAEPNAPGNYCYRVEFSNYPKNYRVWAADANSYAETRFICDDGFGCNNVDLALYDKADYCETDNPPLITSCYTNGDALGGGTTGADDAIVTFNYDGTNKTPVATQAETGSIWGIAYNQYTGEAFLASVMRRHSSFGTLGTGGIYVYDTNTGITSPWLDVNTLAGVNTGTDPHTGLPADKLTPNTDEASYSEPGKISLGDIDISPSGDTLFVVNLNDQSLLMIDTQTKTLIDQISFTDAANNPCATGTPRPWALEIHECKVYAGVTCDPGLVSYVLELQPDGTFAPVLEIPLDYPRDFAVMIDCPGNDDVSANWNNWSDDFADALGGTGSIGAADRAYPQPILADIEIDVDGSFILGYIDRFGLQVGFANYQPYAGTTELELGFIAGDILRACNVNCQGLVLEGGAGCDQVALQDGPEYYQDDFAGNVSTRCDAPDNFTRHDEQTFSGFAMLAGSGQLVANGYDPSMVANTGGTRWFNNATGEVEMGLILTEGNVTLTGLDSKGVSVGDLEVMCSPPPIEVGNYVWFDHDMDGQQDPCEPPLQGITVEIYDAGGILIGTAMTDANGQYYFGGEGAINLTGGALQPNQTYEIRIPTGTNVENATDAQGITQPSDGVMITSTDNTADNIDNDGVMDATNTYATFTFMTDDSGDNIHAYDFGFIVMPVDLALDKTINTNTAMIGDAVTFTITVTNEGPGDATGVEVTDVLPADLVYAGVNTASVGTFDGTTWIIGDLANGDMATLDLTVTVTADGVFVNEAEITATNEIDTDSTPNNDDPTEDDIATACVSVPIEVCDNEAINITIEAPVGYTNYQWYKDGVLIQGETGQTYVITEPGEYVYTLDGVGPGDCQAELCCPVVVEQVSCCPPLQCIPITVEKLDEE